MSPKPLRVALLGCGVVGSEVVRQLDQRKAELAARVGAPLEIAGIAVRRPQRARDLPVDPALFTADAAALVTRDDVDIVIEVVGGIEPARSWMLSAMAGGKSVVTANKALLAADGTTLYEAAGEAGVDLYYEASVAGAIPAAAPAAREPRRRHRRARARHRERHDELHPHADGRDRRQLLRGARGSDRAGLRRSRPDR